MDTDPQLASDMVNMVVEKIDEKNKEPVIRNKQRIVNRFQEDVKSKKVELDTLTMALNRVGKEYGIQVKSDEKGNEAVSGPTAERSLNCISWHSKGSIVYWKNTTS
jgi:hypothetical protein